MNIVSDYCEIETRFIREPAPDSIVTHDLATSKCLAINLTNSSFALPSTGGDFKRAIQVPSSCGSKLLDFEFGFALTRSSMLIKPSRWKLKKAMTKLWPGHRIVSSYSNTNESCADYLEFAVTPGQSSVRNGVSGKSV